MKYTIIVAFMILTIAGMLASPSAAAAVTSGSAVVRVRCTVAPNMSIAALETTMDAGVVTMGAFSVTCNYRVRGNMQDVQVFVEQSPLYKADDPTGKVVAPIPVAVSKGVTVQPARGNARGGHGNVLAFAGTGAAVEGYPTLRTETRVFSTSQSGSFSQQVGVTCWWQQTDSQKPPGEYGGIVRVTAMTLPPG